MKPDDLVLTYRGRRYRLHEGRILLDWSGNPILRHRAGCVLCCDIRVTAAPGSPPRHPENCGNCLTWAGPRPDPCRYCGKTAHLRDEDELPVHKACHEETITATLAAERERRAAPGAA